MPPEKAAADAEFFLFFLFKTKYIIIFFAAGTDFSGKREKAKLRLQSW